MEPCTGDNATLTAVALFGSIEIHVGEGLGRYCAAVTNTDFVDGSA